MVAGQARANRQQRWTRRMESLLGKAPLLMKVARMMVQHGVQRDLHTLGWSDRDGDRLTIQMNVAMVDRSKLETFNQVPRFERTGATTTMTDRQGVSGAVDGGSPWRGDAGQLRSTRHVPCLPTDRTID